MSSSLLEYDAKTYYNPQNIFWNSYEYVRREINFRNTGNHDLVWFLDFKNRYLPRRKALMLNCGNGWVERILMEHGVIKEAVGVDYAETLLEDARNAAGEQSLRYYQLDTNTALFPEAGYDLVVNFAAAHHIAYLDRVFRRLAELLPDDGYFVSYDYVGAHRNQYPTRQWFTAVKLNRKLPSHMRSPMHYPHLKTALYCDPSEAVHSELVVPVMRRYFHIVEHKHMGGGLAYLVLTHNANFMKASPSEQEYWLKVIMDADAEYLEKHPESSQFDYIVAQPNKEVLERHTQLEMWSQEEEAREAKAARNNLEYYPRNP